jgi:hypothetical protein
MDGSPAADSDQRAPGGQGGSILSAHHGGRFRAAVHHAGSRGPDLRPHGAHLRLRAGRSFNCNVHGHSGDRFHAAPGAREGNRNDRRPRVAPLLQSRAALCAVPSRLSWLESSWPFFGNLLSDCGSAASFFRTWKKATFGFVLPCRSRFRSRTARPPPEKCARFSCGIPKSLRWFRSMAGPTTAAMLRRFRMSNYSLR